MILYIKVVMDDIYDIFNVEVKLVKFFGGSDDERGYELDDYIMGDGIRCILISDVDEDEEDEEEDDVDGDGDENVSVWLELLYK